MQIVIDIPEEEYKKAKWKANGVRGLTEIESLVANGTPLPEGHGRLIDADACIDELASAIPYIIDDLVTNAYVEGLSRAKSAIDNAPTVLETEGESENDKIQGKK